MRDPQAEQPFDLLRIDGRSCKLFRNAEQRKAVEAMEGFLPWNGKEDNLIDRFDGRALLDFYRWAWPQTRAESSHMRLLQAHVTVPVSAEQRTVKRSLHAGSLMVARAVGPKRTTSLSLRRWAACEPGADIAPL